MNTYSTPPPVQAPSSRWSARRLVMAVLAYCSVVSVSVAAAAALVSAGVPLEALLVSF